MPFMYVQTPPIPVHMVAHTCLLMDRQGWGPVLSTSAKLTSLSIKNSVEGVSIVFRKFYCKGGEIPKAPVIDYNEKVPGIE